MLNVSPALTPLLAAHRDLLAVLATLSIVALSAALHVRGRLALALGAGAFTLVTPFLASEGAPALRFFLAGSAVLVLFRNLDLWRDERDWSLPRRIWHVSSVFDTRRVRFLAPSFDRSTWLRLLGFSVPTLVLGWLLFRIGRPASAELWVARWLCGAAYALVSIDAVVALLRAGHRLVGIEVPALHRDPVLSRSLAEFWGKRWNLAVHQLLHDHCFRPLARRSGVLLGVAAAFAGSALLHFWITLPAAGLAQAALMGAFFFVQLGLVLLERRLRVARWRRPWQHVWTACAVLLPSPLLIEPLLRGLFWPV